MTAAAASAPLTRRSLAAYGALGLPLALLALPLYLVLPAYYADGLGLGLATVGGVLLAARLWDVVTDPLVGILSDRRFGNLGRRKPWLLAGLPVLMAGTAWLFFPGAGVTATDLLLASLLFHLGATMVMLPWLAWGAELTDAHHERSRVTGVREGFIVVGTVVAAGIAALFADSPGEALRWLGIVLLATLPLGIALALRGAPDPVTAPAARLGLRDGWQALAGNRPFRCLLSAWLLNGLANGLPAGLFLLFVTYRIEAPERAGLLLLLYFGAGLAGIPLWLAASRRFGKHRAWIGAMAASCAFFAAVPFLGAGDVLAFAAICVLTGACLGADLALPPSMQADVVDIDAEETGQRRTGLYFGLWNVATKLALALAVGIAFPLLELAGFTTGSAANDGFALAALAGLYGAAPIACKLAAVALMLRYGAAMTGRAAAANAAGKDFDVSTPVTGFRISPSDSRV